MKRIEFAAAKAKSLLNTDMTGQLGDCVAPLLYTKRGTPLRSVPRHAASVFYFSLF
jgi:predicted ATPase